MPADRDSAGERWLRRAALAGDEQAWRALYESHFDSLWRHVCRRCGARRAIAEDVAQETWLVAVRKLRGFDPDRCRFATWLRGIADNLIRNALRREAVRHHAGPADNGASDLDDPPDRRLEEHERADRIADALAHLPERYEAVLRAKYLDGRSVDEIARRHGTTPKAVESLLSRARAAFRERFGTDPP